MFFHYAMVFVFFGVSFLFAQPSLEQNQTENSLTVVKEKGFCPHRYLKTSRTTKKLKSNKFFGSKLEKQLFQQMLQKIEKLPYLNSLLVLKNDALIIEEYFHGGASHHAYNVKSVSKSILSILVGIALEEGSLKSLETKVALFFPNYSKKISDPHFQELTLAHLLKMRAGFDLIEKYGYGYLE